MSRRSSAVDRAPVNRAAVDRAAVDRAPAAALAAPVAAYAPRRREWLGMTVCLPAAAAGTVLAAALPPAWAAPLMAPAPAPAAVKPHPRGYHRSEHIDTYYASLRY